MVENSQSKASEILVVEDEASIRELVSLLLLRQGHRVQQCSSAIEAYEAIRKNHFNLMILDWMLPNLSGLDFLKSIQSQESKPPVLMLTAKSEPQDIVAGLEAGADDYLTKPFEPSVFTARVKALLRRSVLTQPGAVEVLKMGGLTMNLSSYEVRCQNEVLHLTPSEFKILAEMGKNIGRVMTRDYLVAVVQGDGITVTGRTIDTHVFGLRKKLGPCADVIETIRGVGYRIKVDS